MLLQPSDLPEDCATEKSGFFKFKEALRRVAISTEGRKSRAASGAPSFPGVGGVSEVIYYGHGEGEGAWCWAGRRGCGWTIVDRTWDYRSVTYLLVLTASIEPECENTGESLVWGLMAWEGEGRSMEHFHHEALDLTSSTQEVLL